MAEFNRNRASAIVYIGTDIADSTELCFGGFSGGVIHVPGTEEPVTLTFYVRDTDEAEGGGVYRALNDYLGNPVTISASGGQAYELHPALFGCPAFKVVAGVISGGDSVAYPVTLKA